MKRFLLFLLLSIIAFSGIQAQNESAVSRIPKNLFGSENTAMSTQKTKQKNKKKSLGEHIIDQNDSENLAIDKAIGSLDAGDITAAAQQFDTYDERDADASYGLAITYYLSGDLNSAITELQQAATLEPDNTDILFAMGLVYSDLGNFDAAEQIFWQILENNENDVDAWDALGWLYYAAGSNDAAEACREVVQLIDPNYAMSY